MAQVALVTGAARGIGLELCRQLLEAGESVVACPRKAREPELAALAESVPDRLHVVPMDVADDESIAAAVTAIEGRFSHVDLLFNNAAVYPKDERGLITLDPASLLHAFDVNTLGPLRVIKALLPLLERGEGRRVVQITSLMGSIGDNGSGGSYAYRLSKAALNMAVRNLAHELGPRGFLVLAIHPGWVRTRMGGPHAPTELRAATAEVLRVALAATERANGAFLGPGGTELPY